MGRYLQTNTATVITVGPFLDKTDGVTPEAALTVTNCHLTGIADNAGSPTLALDADATASGGDNDMVHITNDDAGYYTLELTAAQLNYLGGFSLAITDAANHCPVFHEFTILPAQVYTSLIAGTDLLDSNASQFGGQTVTAGAGVTMPATVASTTNITAGVITTVTNLTNAPTNGDLTATMKTSVTTAATAATPIAASVTGAVGSVTGAVGSVTGNVGGNVTGSVGSVAAGGIAAAAFAANAIDAAALAADAGNEIADAVLARDIGSGTNAGTSEERTVRSALRVLRNKFGIVGTTRTVYKENDTDAAFTSVLTTDASGLPITGDDPT